MKVKPLERMYRSSLLSDKEYSGRFGKWEEEFQGETMNLMDSMFRNNPDLSRVPTFYAQNPKLRRILRDAHGSMLKSSALTRTLSTQVRAILDGKHGDDAREAMEKELAGEGDELTDEQAAARLQQLMNRTLEREMQEAADTADAAEYFIGRGLDPADEQATAAVMTSLRNRITLDIMKYVGRFGKLVSKKATIVRETKRGSEIKDVTIGRDLDLMLQNHWSDLACPETEILFLEAFAEGRLFQFSYLEEIEENTNGPLVLMLDVSGSMNELHPVTAGFALAIFEHFQTEGRRCILHTYSTDLRATLDSEQHTLVDVLTMLSRGVGGGTTLSNALRQAHASWPNDLAQSADLIVITDGDDVYSEIRIDLKDMKRTALVIGQTPTSVSTWFDSVMKVDNSVGQLDGSLCKLVDELIV